MENDDISEDRTLKSLVLIKLPFLSSVRAGKADDSAGRWRLC